MQLHLVTLRWIYTEIKISYKIKCTISRLSVIFVLNLNNEVLIDGTLWARTFGIILTLSHTPLPQHSLFPIGIFGVVCKLKKYLSSIYLNRSNLMLFYWYKKRPIRIFGKISSFWRYMSLWRSHNLLKIQNRLKYLCEIRLQRLPSLCDWHIFFIVSTVGSFI